jgi:hypothetical protein
VIFVHLLLAEFRVALQDAADGVGLPEFDDAVGLWVESGVEVGEEVCLALLAFHAFAVDDGSCPYGF